jgi:two-component system chemotaxis response regulator CheB
MKNKVAARPRSHTRPAFWVVGVAASAGGLTALRQILEVLPRDFPAAIVIVQHLSPHHKSYLAEILARCTPLRVKQAEDGDRLHRGEAFIAPPDRHLLVNPDGTLSLTRSGRVHHVRPSADILFASMALACQERAIAVVLTGGDEDGASGARLVKAMGGTVIAQDEASSQHFDMPRAAISTGVVDYVLPVTQIAPLLSYLASNGNGRGPSPHDPANPEQATNRESAPDCCGGATKRRAGGKAPEGATEAARLGAPASGGRQGVASERRKRCLPTAKRPGAGWRDG